MVTDLTAAVIAGRYKLPPQQRDELAAAPPPLGQAAPSRSRKPSERDP